MSDKKASDERGAKVPGKLSTEPYKGVRDFYPEDMAVQQYIFDTWAYTAESFGYERYDASVLEPAALYRAKGAENEEMVNEQTYTFPDRGGREVTLRPEMTPTVARMIAKRQKELAFPVRWYSIPNLFRYERAQRGRLREHWQLNCDIFGADDFTADVEMIALAHQIFMNFGADERMFEIRLNNRRIYSNILLDLAKECDEEITKVQIDEVIKLSDKFEKIPPETFRDQLENIVGEKVSEKIIELVQTNGEISRRVSETEERNELGQVYKGLLELGIKNVKLDASLARGFDYYTGTIFEFKDTDPQNNRSLLGGGRYDNLTGLFSDTPVSGIGFGFGDVTMRDFLESHDLMSTNITSPTLMVIPMDVTLNLEGQKVAQQFRAGGISVATDLSTRKLGKKLAAAENQLVDFALVLGEDEVKNQRYTVKNLTDGTEYSDTIEDLLTKITT